MITVVYQICLYSFCLIRGASLVVSAIAEGRDAARVIDDYLRSTEVTEKQRWLNHGQTIRPRSNLPSVLPVWTNPLRVYHETKQLEAQ